MSEQQPVTRTAVAVAIDDGELTKRQAVARGFRALNYLSIYAFILVVYGGALVTNYFLFSLMWWLLSEEVQKYTLVAQGFNYARIGLAMLFLVGALVHGIISTYSQIKLDLALLREEQNK